MQKVIGWPVSLAARSLALQWLGDAGEAATRLEGGADPEALHDFRVALRRLRVALKAYRPWLEDTVPIKRRAKLGEIARATGSSRDVEVQVAWLDNQVAVSCAEASAIADLKGRLETSEPVAGDARGALRLFRRQKERMEVELGRVSVEPLDAACPEPLLGAATVPIAARRLQRLTDALSVIAHARDDAAIHQARLATKRLRYLLEPLGEELPACAAAGGCLSALQDLLGELHDVAILSCRVAGARSGSPDDHLGAGYVLLSWRVERARLELFEGLAREWLRNGPPGTLQAAVDALAGEGSVSLES